MHCGCTTTINLDGAPPHTCQNHTSSNQPQPLIAILLSNTPSQTLCMPYCLTRSSPPAPDWVRIKPSTKLRDSKLLLLLLLSAGHGVGVHGDLGEHDVLFRAVAAIHGHLLHAIQGVKAVDDVPKHCGYTHTYTHIMQPMSMHCRCHTWGRVAVVRAV